MRSEDLGQCRGTQLGSVGTDADRACTRPEGVAFDVSLAAITPRGVKDLQRYPEALVVPSIRLT